MTEWPKSYADSPRTLTYNSDGGANYTAEDLKAFKQKWGIDGQEETQRSVEEDIPSPS